MLRRYYSMPLVRFASVRAWKSEPRCPTHVCGAIRNENEKYRKSLQCDVYRYARVLLWLNETKRRARPVLKAILGPSRRPDKRAVEGRIRAVY